MKLKRDSVHGNAVEALPLLHSHNRSQLSSSETMENRNVKKITPWGEGEMGRKRSIYKFDKIKQKIGGLK
ncbi:MAG: hypothetical protein JSV88_10765 [Candidatus Aminicenantes bacterium]|nr:MAG: hypothetical protein JSV88_10765 [Candidatus Aminicenantes bacterium]